MTSKFVNIIPGTDSILRTIQFCITYSFDYVTSTIITNSAAEYHLATKYFDVLLFDSCHG